MWILPKQLHTSDFVPDTAALSLDCTELSEICARSLFVRSKPSAARIWRQRWKRDSWTQHLYGRILNPSHGQSFVTAWTSSLGAIPASHSAQPESASAQKTLATSGLSSQTEFDFFAPASASSRMSKDTSASDSERSLESWNKLVIQRRGEYSRRLKSAHLTRESGSLSWPTTNARDWKDSVNSVPPSVGQTRGHSLGMAVAEKNWPTIRASEYKDTGPIGSKSHDHMLGKGYLCAVVTQDAWQTPTTNMDMVRSEEGVQKRIAFRASIGRKSIPDGNLGEQMQRVVKDAANWLTPQSGDVTGSTQEAVVMWANGKRPKTSDQRLRTQVAAEQLKHGQAAPANPSTDGSRQESWATPNAFCYQPPENTEQWTKRAEYQQTEKGVNLHKPIQTQVLHEVEKQWRTPSSSDGEGGVMEMREGCAGKYKLRDHVVAEQKAWATPRVGGEEKAETRLARGKDIGLHGQVGAMKNTAKLNPRWVETLMGLPVGWVMPSCKSPVTIEPTNCDSSATESCLQQPSELFAF